MPFSKRIIPGDLTKNDTVMIFSFQGDIVLVLVNDIDGLFYEFYDLELEKELVC